MKKSTTSKPVLMILAPWGAFAPPIWLRFLLRGSHNIPANRPGMSWIAKTLRRPIKRSVKTLQQPCYDVQIWGMKMRLDPHGNRSEREFLLRPQYFDARERDFLTQHLTSTGVFVDIGANAGVYTYWAIAHLKGVGRIVSFEPDPEMRRRLEFNLATNLIRNVTVLPTALSDHQGLATLYVNRAQRGENTLEKEQAEAIGGDRITIEVELDTLLHAMQSQRIEKVDALKIDIEGHELPVLRHFFENAPSSLWPRALIMEHAHANSDALSHLLRGAGYQLALETRLNHGYLR